MTIARTLWNRRIVMRDGAEMAADVLLPAGGGPFPTLVLRTPYARGRSLNNRKSWIRLVEAGYALVTVDLRGRNDSQGEWQPWVKDPHDAHDTIEWVAEQSWCTGKIGMVGGSYEGLTQWWTALARPRHLACIVPLCIGGVRHQLPFFGTGIPSQYRLWWAAMVLGRTQQFPGAPAWEAQIMHTPLKTIDAAFGLSRSAWRRYVQGELEFGGEAGTLTANDYAAIDIPVLIGVGWWDDQEAMRAWQALQGAKSARECRLLIGAWDHAGNVAPRPVLGGVDVSATVMDTIGYIEQFLALHLKGARTSLADAPRCRVFMTGQNRWDEMDQWPHLDAAYVPFYFASDGDARTLRGNGRLLSAVDGVGADFDTYVYDPNRPARDMSNLAMFAWADPPLDQRYLQRRPDVLVYTSEPLDQPLLVSGRYRLCVFVASDRPDTDLYVSLSDVHPDGRAIGLQATNSTSACLRLRYRNGPRPELLEPGVIYEVTLEGSWMHHMFRGGHRLRITLTSGNFPLMARNGGTGRHWAEDEVLFPQTNTIHHSLAHPSRVLLPVVAKGVC
jgi:uncharacterized protein